MSNIKDETMMFNFGADDDKAAKAKVFIDATGDGDVATWAGASFKKGGEDGILQSSTLCFSFANVDSYNYNLIGPSLHTSNKNSPIFDAIKSGKYPLIGRHFNSNLIGPDVVQFNAGHIDNVDSTDPWATTRAMATGRQIAEQYLEALKELQPKTFGSAFVVKTASLLGVRDSRRIEGDYTFTFQDWLERKTFEDEIGRNCYYIDVHKPGHKETRYKKGESHGIPYRCLTPKGLKNLLVAGRCISTDEEAFGSLRVMPPCLVTGEAAGMDFEELEDVCDDKDLDTDPDDFDEEDRKTSILERVNINCALLQKQVN